MKNIKITSSIFFSILVLTSFISAHVGDDDSAHHTGCIGGMMAGNYGFGMGIFGWLMGLLIVVVIVLLIIWMIKQIQKK